VRGDALERAGRLTFLVDVEEAEVDSRVERGVGRARVEVGGEWPKPRLLDGHRVAVWATLRVSRRAEGVREGLAAHGYCKSARLLERRGEAGPSVRRWAAALREEARGVLTRSMLAGTERGLVRAMVLGDRAEDAFRQSMILSKGSLWVFWSNPLAGTIATLALCCFALPALTAVWRRARG